MTSIDLAGVVALVTGSSRGVGAATARALGRAGARVAVNYVRDEAAARAVAAAIEADGGPPPIVVRADVGDEESRRRLHREVAERLGPPLILVSNAATDQRNPFDEPDDRAFLARWRTTMAVNLEAAAHLALIALPAMRAARFGRIVVVASRSAFRAETDHPDYAVAKAGLVNLARCLARAEGPNGITSNAVCPGWVDTDKVRETLAVRGEAIRAEIPLGRVATPEDVAGAVLFLASPLGSYCNGVAIPLNGGSYLH
ncbi:SDR family oxidoreductase [Acidobacteria bacterium ACD]|nr:SDR family oxidoreductase [Acidobacteria bacterium ACD]